MNFVNLNNNNKQNIFGFINFIIKIISNSYTYSMHDFIIKINIYYLLFLTVVKCKKILSLPSIIAESTNGTTAYTGPNLSVIAILEFWNNLSQRC